MPAFRLHAAASQRPLFHLVLRLLLLALLSSCGGGGGGGGTVTTPPVVTPPVVTPPVVTPPAVNGPAWLNFARDAQHSGLGGTVASQALSKLIWRTPVDLSPVYTSTGALLIHYGSPVISAHNTVVVPVKTGSAGGFRIEAHLGGNGALMWQADSDYQLPPKRWLPSFGPAMTTTNRVYMPGAGGKVWYRDNADSASGTLQSLVFYGDAVYAADHTNLDAKVFINTPITADSAGNVFFGFMVTGSNSANLTGGIARIGADGKGSWISAATATKDPSMFKSAMQAAPALSSDLKTLYVAVNTDLAQPARQSGYLLALDSTTLAVKAAVLLRDPVTDSVSYVTDDSSAAPTVGPDGDVYYGVLESVQSAHNSRGWLLHFDATLAVKKIPGSFGWDQTVSIVPTTMVPGYTGSSSYLLMSKYNNYPGAGNGDGKHRLALLDPTVAQADTYSLPAAQVMKEVMTVLGQTPQNDPLFPGSVREWCVNAAAVDPVTRSILVNSEDGYLYRWSLATNTLSERISLNSGYGQAYTSTLMGPDGLVYAVSNAVLTAVGN